LSILEELERQIQIKTDIIEISQETAFQARMDRFILQLQLKEQLTRSDKK